MYQRKSPIYWQVDGSKHIVSHRNRTWPQLPDHELRSLPLGGQQGPSMMLIVNIFENKAIQLYVLHEMKRLQASLCDTPDIRSLVFTWGCLTIGFDHGFWRVELPRDWTTMVKCHIPLIPNKYYRTTLNSPAVRSNLAPANVTRVL